MPVPAERPVRALLTFTLDLNAAAPPGDTVRYLATARDNTPGTGRPSREFVLRLPTMSEVRAAQRQATESVASQLDSITGGEPAARTPDGRSGAGARRGQTEDRAAKDSDVALVSKRRSGPKASPIQEELIKQAEELSNPSRPWTKCRGRRSARHARGSGSSPRFGTSSTRRSRRSCGRSWPSLQQALKDLDAERAKDALQLAEAQQELREALERSRELFRRAALEGDLANLSQEAKELAREQREWNEQVELGRQRTLRLAERQLATRADSLAAALEQVGQR